jgi:hypothetical protein
MIFSGAAESFKNLASRRKRSGVGNFFEARKVRLNFMRKTFAIFLSQTAAGEGGGQNWIRTSEGVSQRIYSPVYM